MKLSKRKADRNELYGLYIKYFAKIQKIYTFEMYLKTRQQLIVEHLKGKIKSL
jgi:hypothetical protein